MNTKELNSLSRKKYKNLSDKEKGSLTALTPNKKEFKKLSPEEQLDFVHGNLIRLHKKVDGILEKLDSKC